VSGRLDGKVALVTGAAQGIRAAIARRFAAEGARVIATDADDLDVTSEEAWEEVARRARDEHGGVDVLVNNAGLFLAGPLHETSLEEFRRLQEVNQVGVFLGMRTIAPLIAERGGGSIINLSSIAGRMGSPYLTAYAASKWAVRGMTKCVAKELAATGRPGQLAAPGPDRHRDARPTKGADPGADRQARRRNPDAADRDARRGRRRRGLPGRRRERLHDRQRDRRRRRRRQRLGRPIRPPPSRWRISSAETIDQEE
jgi:3alpha(or 20beta)-hydroxysteroid dehydrogenase